MPTTGVLDKKYVSALTLMDKREIDGKIQDVSNDIELLDYMKLFNRTKPTAQAWYYNHVNEDLIGVGDTTGESVTGTGTATITATTTVATSGQFREGDIVKLRDKNARVTSVTPNAGKDTLVMASVDGSNITFAAGNRIVWSSNSLSEGSDSRTNLRYRTEAYYNHIQILGEVHKSTDIENMTEVEVTVDGKSRYSYYDYVQKILLLKKAVGGMLIGGQISATRFSDANPALIGTNGYAAQTSMGLDQYVSTYAGARALSTLGTHTLADINAKQDIMIANKCPKKFLVTGSTRAMRPIMTMLKNLGSSGLTSVRMNIDGTSVNLNVEQWKWAGFEYEFLHCSTFDDPSMYPTGTNVNDIGKSLYYLPKDKVNLVGGGSAERFRIRYFDSKAKLGMQGPNTKWSDLISESITGGLAPIATDGKRTRTVDWTTYQGLEILGAKHFFKESVVA